MARLYQITRLYVICLADIHVAYGTGQAQILLVISTIRRVCLIMGYRKTSWFIITFPFPIKSVIFWILY